jgi:hypothetical protein
MLDIIIFSVQSLSVMLQDVISLSVMLLGIILLQDVAVCHVAGYNALLLLDS